MDYSTLFLLKKIPSSRKGLRKMPYHYKTKVYLYEKEYQLDSEKMASSGWEVAKTEEIDSQKTFRERTQALSSFWFFLIALIRVFFRFFLIFQEKIKGKSILTVVQYRRDLGDSP